ncbi:MAG: hypothetical protein ACLSCV_08410 [Acutalibacteraceae bacterium]
MTHELKTPLTAIRGRLSCSKR